MLNPTTFTSEPELSFISINENLNAENEPVDDDEEPDLTGMKLQYLDEALKKLPPDEIFLVTLYYFKEQSIETVSRVCDLSTANVKVKLHRIRKKLALEINRLLENEYK